MSLLRIAVVLVGVVAAAASATVRTPAKHDIKRAEVIPLDYEATWTKVIDVFADRGWPIDNLDKASGLITTDWMGVDVDEENAFADCGEPRPTRGVDVRFNVRVKPLGAATEVTVNARFQGGNLECTSRGAVEAMIHDHVAGRARPMPIAPPAPPPPQEPAKVQTGRGI